MLYFGGKVERQLGELLVHRADHAQRVFGSVQKVRVAERDVRGAGPHLGADICQHHFQRQDEEPPLVHWRDRAMRAKVQTAPAGLHVARGATPPVVLELRIFLQ